MPELMYMYIVLPSGTTWSRDVTFHESREAARRKAQLESIDHGPQLIAKVIAKVSPPALEMYNVKGTEVSNFEKDDMTCPECGGRSIMMFANHNALCRDCTYEWIIPNLEKLSGARAADGT